MKQEDKELLLKDFCGIPTLHGWVARDKSGEICFYKTKPNRSTKADVWDALISETLQIDNRCFNKLTWEEEPIEVELLIKEYERKR